MVEELPEIEDFTSSVARLHKSTLSPNGKYGFPVTTYMGPLPQDNRWCDTWEEYFVQGMRRMLELERNAQGSSSELDELAAKLYDKVIPRLLRPLTTLRSIEPVVIHGDLWYGNCCTDVASGKPIVFDACTFYAHNECQDHFSGVLRPVCLLTFFYQMRLVPGGSRDIVSASHTSKRIRLAFPCPPQKKIMMTEILCTQCRDPFPCHATKTLNFIM